MALDPGRKLGPYVIEAPLGAGGMGVVYRSRDTRLDRTVAIKVLPPHVADDETSRARFEREAKTISGMNHPNICVLYDIGHDDGVDYLVMEYIEGQTLSSRLNAGPMESEELLKVAIQVADALDKAHRQGLIHRDLKPGNIMLTKQGAKLLDFGLAKLQAPEESIEPDVTRTHTTPLTGQGTIVGTVQYMAPEQLEGGEADARSDLFAFGAVLYEMATGKSAFKGEGQASLIAAIMRERPEPISQVSPLMPPMLERVVSQCLEKDPDDRWQTAGDLKRALEWIAEGGSKMGLPTPVARRRKVRFHLASALATAATIVAVVLAVLWFTRPEMEDRSVRFVVETDSSLRTASWPRVSPDGQYLAFLASDENGVSRIYVRPLNSLEAYPLSGTEGAGRPFWSPDSKHLGFIVNRGQMKRVPVAGGQVQLIGETNGGADASWGSGGVILYDGSRGDALRKISASGGVATPATKLDTAAGEIIHSWPWFLPDGQHYLYLIDIEDTTGGSSWSELVVGRLDSDEVVELIEVDSRIEYCEPGYLLYVKDDVLLAQAFDAEALEVTGDPLPLVDQVGKRNTGLAHFGVSDAGILAVQPAVSSTENRMVWLDRKGREMEQEGELGMYVSVSVSPDGKRLAYSHSDGGEGEADVWIRDLTRKVSTRLTFETGLQSLPVWSPDGKYIYYTSNPDGQWSIARRLANGLGDSEHVIGVDRGGIGLSDISPDGTTLYCMYNVGNFDVYTYRLSDTTKTLSPLLATDYMEIDSRVSPDGRYLAYSSWESGRLEVYVRGLEGTGGKWQVSSTGGQYPSWNGDGTELYYITPLSELMAVPVRAGETFEVSRPEMLFSTSVSTMDVGLSPYTVSSDGQRFLVIVPATEGGGTRFHLTTNWHAGLGRE